MARRLKQTQYECLVVAISSHGTEAPSENTTEIAGALQFVEMEDVIMARKGTVPIADLMEAFNERKCPTLKDKPKLFFIQVGCFFSTHLIMYFE